MSTGEEVAVDDGDLDELDELDGVVEVLGRLEVRVVDRNHVVVGREAVREVRADEPGPPVTRTRLSCITLSHETEGIIPVLSHYLFDRPNSAHHNLSVIRRRLWETTLIPLSGIDFLDFAFLNPNISQLERYSTRHFGLLSIGIFIAIIRESLPDPSTASSIRNVCKVSVVFSGGSA